MGRDVVSKGELTRESILEGAYQLFLQQGYHGTSMRQIAEEAGIALGGIYNHFSGKEEIFTAALEAYHPIHEIVPMIQASEGATIEEYVRNAAMGMMTALERQPGFLNLIFIEIVEFNSQHLPDLVDMTFPKVMSIVGPFAESQNKLKDIPLQSIVRSFIGLMFMQYFAEKLVGSQFVAMPLEEAFEQTLQIFLHGILAE
ncbi:MAG: TetR/AcrR family transcriptional regulator [Chloroflexota bacterium]|nr:TetR/AcrR family transcriptional regulator [Chloroflexota bacterium]